MKENERFMDDDGLKQAAAVYQRIQAPSDLRERVLQGIEREDASVSIRRISRSKICKLGTLAACVAVLAVSVSLWNMEDQLSQLTPETVNSSPTSAYEIPDEVIPDEGNPDVSGAADVKEETVRPDDLPDASNPASPQVSSEAAEKKTAAKKAAAKPEAVQIQALRHLAEDGNPTEEKSLSSVKAGGADEGISVGKLLPGMLCNEKTLDDWEIRVVDASEGTCTVEVSGGEKTTTVVLTRGDGSEESSQWTIQSAENNSKGEE
ncbi:MAG: hypothetical protein ACI4WY_12575 [Anaerovoracaceae bacterium]